MESVVNYLYKSPYMALNIKSCSHLEAVSTLRKANAYECAACVKSGDRWVHLRTCQECGITLCCDSSPNKHATQHFHSHQHPVIASAEPGEYWLWCYADRTFAEYDPAAFNVAS